MRPARYRSLMEFDNPGVSCWTLRVGLKAQHTYGRDALGLQAQAKGRRFG